MVPRQEHYDLHDTPRIDNGRIPLPSARKTEVDENPVHFGVARTKAAHILSCMPGVLDIGRIPLPSAWEFEVGTICSHFGVLI